MIVFGEEVCAWTAKRTGGSYFAGSGFGIGWVRNDKLVAGVLFDNYTGQSVQMHVGSDGDGWLVRSFLRLCYDYPFNSLKVKKVVAIVDSTNHESLRFCLHLGYVEEAVIKDAGKHGDLHILTMTRQQCRFI